MSIELLERYSDISEFRFRGGTYSVRKTGSMAVCQGVVCDTYAFEDDDQRDLGIIKIEPGCQTPLQCVVGGDFTIEAHVAGVGRLLTGMGSMGLTEEYHVQEYSGLPEPSDVIVPIGGLMRWVADDRMPLVAAEVCYPPYEDGRFLNLG